MRMPIILLAVLLMPSLLVSLAGEPPTLQQPAAKPVRYAAKEGKLRIEGSSVVHDWQAEGREIRGFLEIPPDFPALSPRPLTPGAVQARAEASIPVGSLKSVEKDGRPYSAKFDEILYEKLEGREHPTVDFRLGKLVWRAVQQGSYVFDASGVLVVGGITNAVEIPVTVTTAGANQLRVTGSTSLKQSDFGIPPPIIDTERPRGDFLGVKVVFDWTVENQKAQ